MTARAVFAALAGTWDLDRRLEPDLGTMRGTATFTRVTPTELHYAEEGTLRLANGHVGAATRAYRYHLVDDGADGDEGDDGADARIEVCFTDDRYGGGRLMHALRFGADGSAVARDEHVCAADTYTGTYEFRLPELVVVTMAVRGPAKDYTTVTRLYGSSGSRPARWSS